MMKPLKSRLVFDSGVTKVMILASILIVFSILLIGTFVYTFTEKEVVKKLKSRDLITIAELISTKVDARIDKAIETSLLMAHDPALLEWLASGERDHRLADRVFRKTAYIHEQLEYSITFIANVSNGHYWNQYGEQIDILLEDDPDDVWFYQAIASGKAVDVNFDYNEALGDTFAFVNALAGPLSSPAAFVGVGMSLHDLSDDFALYKKSEGINLWLIDSAGKIYLSDTYEDNGKNLRDMMASSAQKQLLAPAEQEIQVIEYETDAGQLMDLISYPLKSIHLQLLVEIERDETVSFLKTIRWNTLLAVVISIISIVFFFFYVSRKLANPYKRALSLNQELETQVEVRTHELFERNMEIMDSINYAKRLQESVMPTDDQLRTLFPQHFVILKPRDVIGGDFFWIKRVGETSLVAVGDCTGHGVPGAFMTLLAVSVLNRAVDLVGADEPAAILGELNRMLKETLHQEELQGATDDGLDIGLCCIRTDTVIFAGAGCALHRIDSDGLQIWQGDRRSIGYRRTPMDYSYTNHPLPSEEASYYLTTDGFYDQNGGEYNYSFGKKRFAAMIERYSHLPFSEQKTCFIQELESYKSDESQRDDITVLSFRSGAPSMNDKEWRNPE